MVDQTETNTPVEAQNTSLGGGGLLAPIELPESIRNLAVDVTNTGRGDWTVRADLYEVGKYGARATLKCPI